MASLILLGGISVGCVLGLIFKEKSVVFKPFGDIFLNLLFTIVVPLVFFSLSSTVATMSDLKRLSRILIWMMVVFIVTGIIACFLMIAAVGIFPPAEGVTPCFTCPCRCPITKYRRYHHQGFHRF